MTKRASCVWALAAVLGCAGIPRVSTAATLREVLPGLPGANESRTIFVGSKAFTDAQLRAAQAELVAEIDQNGVTPARADDLAFYIGSYYRKSGFAQASVDFRIEGDRLTILIHEGPRTLLRGIAFRGNRTIPDSELYQYMIGATPDQLTREPAKFPYTAAEVGAGVDRIRGLYLSRGYLKAEVNADTPQFSAGGTRADVSVRIAEGAQFLVGEIRFEGVTAFDRASLLAALKEPVTGPFAPGIAEAMRRNLESFLKAHGYYAVKVEVQADAGSAAGGRVPVTFRIGLGGLFRYDSVTIRNTTERPRLRPDFLKERFAPLSGQIYNPDKLAEIYREMLRTGIFDSLRVSPRAIPGQQVAIDIVASEAKAKEVGVTLGAGSYEGFDVGLRLGDRDLFGRGRPLSFSADVSSRGLRSELEYQDPWLFDTTYSLRARAFSEDRQELGYSKKRYGGRLDLSRKYLPRLELGRFVEVAEGRVESTGIEPQFLGPQEYRIGTIGLTQNSDFRNDPVNPRRGYVLNTTLDGSTIGGGPSFVRATGRISYYLPIGRTLLSVGVRGGIISADAHDLPIDVRFFNGGANSVRSFAERELGPKDRRGNPLGGDSYTIFNIEYTMPITHGFEGAVFGDAGSLRNSDAPQDEGMRYAIGAGLRYQLPIGALRLDYGFNPDRRGDEAIGAFHFSFGVAF